MPTSTDGFARWLTQANIPIDRLTDEQRALLRFVFQFRQECGHDYFDTRVLSHFLLHCGSGLKIAHIARLLGIDRTTASRQQGLSSKQTIQAAHHRLDGRPYGKLLSHYAGPIAGFLFEHPGASRADVIDFISRTWGIRVSRIALYHFLKRYGLEQLSPRDPASAVPAIVPLDAPLPAEPLRAGPEIPAGRPVPTPAPPFSPHARSTPAPFSSCRRR